MSESLPPFHVRTPTPHEPDPLEVSREITEEMDAAFNLESPDDRVAAFRTLLLDQGGAAYLGEHGDVVQRGRGCEAAGHLIDDEDRAAVARGLFGGERLVEDVRALVHQLVHQFRGNPDFSAEFVAPLIAQTSFGATLLPPDLKMPKLRALLEPEACLALELSGRLDCIQHAALAATELPVDEMHGVWRDLLSVKVCEILRANGTAEQVMWAEHAVRHCLPDGEVKEARLEALRPSDLPSNPMSWRRYIAPTHGEASAPRPEHWEGVARGRNGTSNTGSWSTSSATPPNTPRGPGLPGPG